MWMKKNEFETLVKYLNIEKWNDFETFNIFE